MKIAINLKKLREEIQKEIRSSLIIDNAADLKTVLETLFCDDGFIKDIVTVEVISFAHDNAVVALHAEAPAAHRGPKEHILCAARFLRKFQ